MVFLFPFWGHFCTLRLSFLLHASKSKPSYTVNCGKKVCGGLFPLFPPPQVENMKQILFMYAVTSEEADMLLSLKKNPELFILQLSTRALNLKAPLGPAGTDCGELFAAFPRLLSSPGKTSQLLNLFPALR